jgi:crotonobetainyl-CoA:carnitine CoA-transferase CaiB-like acyl-CoA transferase
VTAPASPRSDAAAARHAARPLDGVTVLDLTTFLSGPFATQILADLGADVIKVESLDGDSSRAIPPYFVGEDSAYFLANNRSKRSIALNLKAQAGRRIAERLIGLSDVVIENFRPGVCKRLGLDVEKIRADRPELVWASISGFGQEGPLRDQPAYDMVVQALSGVMSLTGEPGRPSVRLGIPAGDLVAGMYATIAVVAALLDQRRTGVGRVVDVSMLDCQLAMLSYQGVYSLVAGITPGPQGRGHDSIPTYRSFQGGDGREFVVTANTERMWQELCEAIGRPELVAEERFRDAHARLANKEQLWPILEAEFARQPAAQWVVALTDRSVPASLIKTVPEALEDAQHAGRGMVAEVSHPDGRTFRTLGNPIKFTDQNADRPGYPPTLGEHTGPILGDLLGLTADDIARLHADGIVRLHTDDLVPGGRRPASAPSTGS